MGWVVLGGLRWGHAIIHQFLDEMLLGYSAFTLDGLRMSCPQCLLASCWSAGVPIEAC